MLAAFSESGARQSSRRPHRSLGALPAAEALQSCEPVAESLQVSRGSPAAGDFVRSGAPLLSGVTA